METGLLKVFISYSHKDEYYKDLLISHLSPLKRRGIIDEWNDRAIIPSQDWDISIKSELLNADIILLLISADFLASNYCYDIEIEGAIRKHFDGTAKVIPIILRPCDWMDLPFSNIQTLPKDALPLSKWDDIDEGILDVVEGIKKCASSLKKLKKEKSESDKLTLLDSLNTFNGEELGLIDYQEFIELYMDISNKSLNNISDSITWVGEEISKKANEITALTLDKKNVNRNQVKTLFIRTAKIMNNFAKKIEPDIPLFYFNFKKTMDSMSGLIDIYNADFEVDKAEINKTYLSLLSLNSSIQYGLESMQGLLKSVNNLPRISKELNYAKANMSAKLGELILRLEESHALSFKLQKKFEDNL